MNGELNPILSRADLTELTGYKRHTDQCAWLAEQGVRFGVRPDGSAALTWQDWYARGESIGPRFDKLNSRAA